MKKLTIFSLCIFICGSVLSQEMETPKLLRVGSNPIDLEKKYAAPLIIDYDKDGLEDLIVGTKAGNFKFYKNIGSRDIPKYKTFSYLKANGKKAVAKNW